MTVGDNGAVGEISVLSAQFCYGAKAALKTKVYLKTKQNQNQT
jgi:hypothetical protein